MFYNTLSESVLVLLRSFTGDSICEKTKFQKLNRLARIWPRERVRTSKNVNKQLLWVAQGISYIWDACKLA